MNPPATDLPGAYPALLVRLAGFFGFLRKRGLAVGIGAEVDLGHALRHVNVLDRGRFRDACRATLAKSPSDLAVLDQAFDEYWSSLPSAAAASEPSPETGVPASPPADEGPNSPSPPRPVPLGTAAMAEVRIGVYSPDAPPAGHSLRPLGSRRLSVIGAGARRFRRFAATLPGRRYKPFRRGRIDFRRTFRHTLRFGAEWLDLKRMRRKRLRAELLILWDVSGSMRDHDSELAALVYSLQRVVRRTRVFAFSTHLQELTSHLAGNPYRRAITSISRILGPAGGGTRIGRCLREFRYRYGGLVHRRTTVLILSDGWDLGETNLLSREVRWLRGRAHLVAWVNPYAGEPRFRPETAGMREALPHIDLLLGPRDFESTEHPWAHRPMSRREMRSGPAAMAKD